MIQAFLPYTAQEAFADGIRFRGPIRRLQDLNRSRLRRGGEGLPIFAIPIPNEKARALTVGRRLAQLLGHPGIRGMGGDTEVYDPPRGGFNN